MGTWRKSSYSGEGDGNACVEIATAPTHISVRDSKMLAPRTVVRWFFPNGPLVMSPKGLLLLTDKLRPRACYPSR
ncbi:DUF397 domain-containing protein [Streptomyces apricus]|uniref:DUF397 domain-containing protein n=1 Tax=Streptomyces apricus TaxID=1828112 RepID=UPI0038B67001